VNAQLGRSLKLYLVDGTPTGVITAELGVSSMRAAVASRTALPELIKRKEASQTGIYLLSGPDPDLPTRDLVYVGEGDQVKSRLTSHDSDEAKDFFTRAVFVVSKDENLTKAHGRYLEGRLIKQIKSAGRARLANGTAPESSGLPEPEIADMERELAEIEVLLPVLGFDVLRPVGKANQPNAESQIVEPERIFKYNYLETTARAKEAGGEFILLQGSQVNRKETNTCNDGASRNRAEALETGDLEEVQGDQKHWLTTKDLVFRSPSGAASFVYGGNISGPRYWTDEATGKTYAELRAAELEDASAIEQPTETTL